MKSNRPFTVAIDFDGTIAVKADVGPKIMGIVPGAKDAIKAMQDAGIECFLWTCRSVRKDWYRDALDFCVSHDITLSHALREGNTSGMLAEKAKAHVYIDDHAVGAPVMTGMKAMYGEEADELCIDWARALPVVLMLHKVWKTKRGDAQ